MASIYDNIRAGLETKLNSISGLPTIAWENVTFSPTTSTPFIKVTFIPVTRRPAVRGLTPQQRYEGVFQLLVYDEDGDGPASASSTANTLIEEFDATTDIHYNTVTGNLENSGGTNIVDISIDYAERQAGIVESPWYYIPVDIGWYIYAN